MSDESALSANDSLWYSFRSFFNSCEILLRQHFSQNTHLLKHLNEHCAYFLAGSGILQFLYEAICTVTAQVCCRASLSGIVESGFPGYLKVARMERFHLCSGPN